MKLHKNSQPTYHHVYFKQLVSYRNVQTIRNIHSSHGNLYFGTGNARRDLKIIILLEDDIPMKSQFSLEFESGRGSLKFRTFEG